MKTLLAALFSVSAYASSIGVNANIQLNGPVVKSCSGAYCDISYTEMVAGMPRNAGHVVASGSILPDGFTLHSALYSANAGSMQDWLVDFAEISATWTGDVFFAGTGQGMADLHVAIGSTGNSGWYDVAVNGIGRSNQQAPYGISNIVDTFQIPVTFGVATPVTLDFYLGGMCLIDSGNGPWFGMNRDYTVSVLEASTANDAVVPNPEPSTFLPLLLLAIYLAFKVSSCNESTGVKVYRNRGMVHGVFVRLHGVLRNPA